MFYGFCAHPNTDRLPPPPTKAPFLSSSYQHEDPDKATSDTTCLFSPHILTSRCMPCWWNWELPTCLSPYSDGPVGWLPAPLGTPWRRRPAPLCDVTTSGCPSSAAVLCWRCSDDLAERKRNSSYFDLTCQRWEQAPQGVNRCVGFWGVLAYTVWMKMARV